MFENKCTKKLTWNKHRDCPSDDRPIKSLSNLNFVVLDPKETNL